MVKYHECTGCAYLKTALDSPEGKEHCLDCQKRDFEANPNAPHDRFPYQRLHYVAEAKQKGDEEKVKEGEK